VSRVVPPDRAGTGNVWLRSTSQHPLVVVMSNDVKLSKPHYFVGAAQGGAGMGVGMVVGTTLSLPTPSPALACIERILSSRSLSTAEFQKNLEHLHLEVAAPCSFYNQLIVVFVRPPNTTETLVH
jgi:hypothetical protein